jgi:hypothetical protein
VGGMEASMTDLEEFVHWTKIETLVLAGNSRM